MQYYIGVTSCVRGPKMTDGCPVGVILEDINIEYTFTFNKALQGLQKIYIENNNMFY